MTSIRRHAAAGPRPSYVRAVVLFTLLLVCVSESAVAQPAYPLVAGKSELGARATAALTSATAPYRGDQVSFGRSYVVGVRYGRVLGAAGVAAVMYVGDLVPLAVTTEIPRGPDYTVNRDPAYGLGISPLGLQVVVAPSRRLAFYIGATGGFVLFNRGVPVMESHQFNFRVEADVGIRIAAASGWGATFDVGLQHLSNGTRNVPNPGLDYRVLSLGVVRVLGS